MGSSAQNSSGVQWCRARSGSTGFRRRFPRLVQSQVGFNRVPEKVPEKVPGSLQGSGEGSREGLGGFGAEPGQVQQGFGEGSGEGLGGFGAEPGQVQRGSGEGSGEGSRKPWCKAKSSSTGFRRRFQKRFRRRSGRVWCKAKSGSTGFRRRFQEALVQSQVRLNRVPENVPEKVWEALAQPGQVQQGSGEGCREGRRRFWESLMQGQVRFQQVQQNSSAWLHRKIKRCGTEAYFCGWMSQLRNDWSCCLPSNSTRLLPTAINSPSARDVFIGWI